MVFRHEPFRHERMDVTCRKLDERDLLLLENFPYRRGVWVRGIAVEQDERTPCPERGEHPVPHHPRARRDI